MDQNPGIFQEKSFEPWVHLIYCKVVQRTFPLIGVVVEVDGNYMKREGNAQLKKKIMLDYMVINSG